MSPILFQKLAQAKALLQQGQVNAASVFLKDLLAHGYDDAELHFLHGMALMQLGGLQQAIAAFDAALVRSPANPAILFNRALAYFSLEDAANALRDFKQVALLHPSASDAHANAGILLLRMAQPGEAVAHLRQALQIMPGDSRIRRSLGNALQALGQSEEALQLLAEAERMAGHEPAVLTDYGMALLSQGKYAAARERFQRALSIQPRDQTALAGLYLAANVGGDTETVDELMRHTQLLAGESAPQTLDTEALREAILANSSLRWEPAGRSTRNGQQTVMLDLQEGSPFAAFGQYLQSFIARRIAQIGNDSILSHHIWGRQAPSHWRIQAWATVLYEGGHQSPHIHPAGWLSGVFYVDSGNAEDQQDGQLLFGHPPEMGLDIVPHEHVHQPVSGRLMSFPSYYFHHTRPYRGSRPRISLAFDVIPSE